MESFVDEATITVVAGHGGAGAVSWRREPYVPKGGPDGGNGGDGGDVLIVASGRITTFYDIKMRKLFHAKNGEAGKKRQADGKNGEPRTIFVPVGTVVYGEDTDTVLADLTADGERFLAARGGKGGKGNKFFATSTNRAPEYAQPGIAGEERTLRLEIKLIASVGLVGFPNAGKSTLLSALTKANPKIANYPFTTLTPNLGVCVLDYERSFVIADIPGIIEGAHEGAGLGIRFLKHIERTKALCYVFDISESYRYEDFQTLTNELASFRDTLATKDAVIVFNKNDLVDDETVALVQTEFEARLTKDEQIRIKTITSVSAATRNGLPELTELLYSLSRERSS